MFNHIAISDPDVNYRNGMGKPGFRHARPRDAYMIEREKRLIHMLRSGVRPRDIAIKLNFKNARTISAYKSELKKKGFNVSLYD